jgi:hypothetical protein
MARAVASDGIALTPNVPRARSRGDERPGRRSQPRQAAKCGGTRKRDERSLIAARVTNATRLRTCTAPIVARGTGAGDRNRRADDRKNALAGRIRWPRAPADTRPCVGHERHARHGPFRHHRGARRKQVGRPRLRRPVRERRRALHPRRASRRIARARAGHCPLRRRAVQQVNAHRPVAGGAPLWRAMADRQIGGASLSAGNACIARPTRASLVQPSSRGERTTPLSLPVGSTGAATVRSRRVPGWGQGWRHGGHGWPPCEAQAASADCTTPREASRTAAYDRASLLLGRKQERLAASRAPTSRSSQATVPRPTRCSAVGVHEARHRGRA